MDRIYFSLDEAREEIKKRWNDPELKQKIEAELGDKFMPFFSQFPRSVLTKQVCVADNGFVFHHYCSKYMNAETLSLEFLGDTFVHFNEEKKGLGRPRLVLEDGSKVIADMISVKDNENKKLSDCVLSTGENLIDFHHRLIAVFGYDIEIHDNTAWYKNIGSVTDYYYFLLLHFVAHGILFEVFQTEEDASENSFTTQVVLPAIAKIEQKFGLKPLFFRHYPQDQTDEEDFYWWCFPPTVNQEIVAYAEEKKVKLKKVEI